MYFLISSLIFCSFYFYTFIIVTCMHDTKFHKWEKKNNNNNKTWERQIFYNKKTNLYGFFLHKSQSNEYLNGYWEKEMNHLHDCIRIYICVVTRCILYVSYHLSLLFPADHILHVSLYPSCNSVYCQKFVVMIIYVFRKSSKGILRKSSLFSFWDNSTSSLSFFRLSESEMFISS